MTRCAALAFPALAVPALALGSPASAASSPTGSLELSVSTAFSEPVAGQDYPVGLTVRNSGVSASEDLRLFVWLSPGLELDSAPAGCEAAVDISASAVACWWPWLAGGSAITVPLTVQASRPGTVVAVRALVRADRYRWAYATVIRCVICPPPPAGSPAPPASRTPSPPAPAPSPSAPPAPARRTRHRPVRPGRPIAVHPHVGAPVLRVARALPVKPRSGPARHSAPLHLSTAELLAPPPRAPKPALPLVVLITAILAPCVAAAATRFGRR